MSGAPEGYVEVNERIAAFYERYPEGSLRCGKWYMRKLGEQEFVVYQALAYRSPRDPNPGEGWAWEPFPGKTPFTKDSELMNAETSAWGRALAALGFEVHRGVASSAEVRERQQPTQKSKPAAPKVVTAPQKKKIHARFNELATPESVQQAVKRWYAGGLETARMPIARASALIEALEREDPIPSIVAGIYAAATEDGERRELAQQIIDEHLAEEMHREAVAAE